MNKGYKVKEKIVYLDPKSINKENLNSFIQSYEWPLKEKQFQVFSNSLLEKYYSLIRRSKNSVFLITLIETQMVFKLIEILHYNYVQNYCKNKKIRIVSAVFSSIFIVA